MHTSIVCRNDGASSVRLKGRLTVTIYLVMSKYVVFVAEIQPASQPEIFRFSYTLTRKRIQTPMTTRNQQENQSDNIALTRFILT